MNRIFKILILACIFVSVSCSKDNLFDCFKGTGDIVKQERDVPYFTGIHLQSNMSLVLIQDSSDKVIVEAGEKLQDGIKTSVNDNMLVINNENKCNWTRSYDNPMNVYVHFKKLDSIYYRSSGDISCPLPWNNDSVKVIVFEGGGSINLTLNSYKSEINIRYGTVDLTLNGVSQVSYISSNSYGPVNALGLQTVYSYLHNTSTNNFFAFATLSIDAKISSVGNIYYKGNPQSVTENTTGSGRLIKMD